MTELSLVEAFRECGPLIGDPAVDSRRTQAAARLLRETQRLVTKIGYRSDVAEDAASTFMVRFIANGPRGPRPDDPQSDEAVASYLYRSLRNEAHSSVRKTHREVPLLSDSTQHPSESLTPGQAHVETLKQVLTGSGDLEFHLERAYDRFFGEVVPFVVARMPEGAHSNFVEAVQVRRAIADGLCTCDESVIKAFGSLNKQTRATFDQRQCRALKRLGDGLETFIAVNSVSTIEAHALREVLHALKNREAFWGERQGEFRS